MRQIRALAVSAISSVLATSVWAADYSVSRSLQLAHPSADIWRYVGGFCDIDDWHPGVIGCELKVIEGKLHRVLTTATGDQFVDQRIAKEKGLSYTYRSSEMPLTVDHFVATLSIEPIGGTQVTWSANFSSEDPSIEAKVIKLIESGLAGIEGRFKAN